MAAEIGTSNNVLAGVRELSMVTNTYAGHMISGGLAYDILLPWQADKIEVYNFTKFATNSEKLMGTWFRDMPTTGGALVISRGTTDLTSVLETTAGVIVNNTASAFADEHVTITGITTATPGVVTAAAHGLVADDRVIITKLTGNIGDELNNKEFVVQNVTTNTFELYDHFGNAVTVASTYSASGGQINKMKQNADVVNSQPVYKLTLGTGLMGNDGDVLYFVAYKFNSYFDLGDVGA